VKIAKCISGTQGTTLPNIRDKHMRVGIFELNLFELINLFHFSHNFIFLILVAGAIKENVQGAEVIFNLVPKAFAMADIYC